MSLTAALHIGRTGLAASQIGIQVAGNNMANAATPGYSRQIARLSPLRGGGAWPSNIIGAGVSVNAIERQVDKALQARLWSSISDQGATEALAGTLGQIEAMLGELGDSDLSSELSAFFKSWSERANQTKSSAAVVQQGDKLASFVRRLRGDLGDLRSQGDLQIGSLVERANQLVGDIARLNGEISTAEVAGQTANTLRDQRDQLITELSQYVDVSVVDRGREGTDVLVGSTPIVLGSRDLGLQVVRSNDASGQVRMSVRTEEGDELTITSGKIGALLAGRSSAIDATLEKLDQLTKEVVWQVNRLHSTGIATKPMTATTGQVSFTSSTRALALNDPANGATGSLPFEASNGGFTVRVKHDASGATTLRRIDIDLDGINALSQSGTQDDTTAEDIVAALDAVDGITASFDPDGRLQVTSDEGFSFSFEDDSSGALAALGVNAFFSGTDAATIGVRTDLITDPTSLASGRFVGGILVENGTALEIAKLQDVPLESLGGQSIPGLWRDAIQGVAGAVGGANSAAQAAALVRDSLENQVAAISGVSIDEESINLLQYQRQYQAAARVISVADELTNELINLV